MGAARCSCDQQPLSQRHREQPGAFMLFVGRGAGGNGTNRRYAARKRCVKEKKRKRRKNRVPFTVNNSGRVAHIRPSVRPVCKHFAPFNVTGVFFMFFFFLCPTERKKKSSPIPKFHLDWKKNATRGKTKIPQLRRHNKDKGNQASSA